MRGITWCITGNVGAGDRVASSVTGFLAHLMALGIGQDALTVPVTVVRGMSMNRAGFPGAVHAYGASPEREAPRDEDGKRVAAPTCVGMQAHRGRWRLPTTQHLARNVPRA